MVWSRKQVLGSVAGVLLLAGAASAQSLFGIDAETTDGLPLQVSSEGDDLWDLVEEMLDQDQAFSDLEGRAFDASLRYGGVDDAVQFSTNDDATEVTVSFPSTGFSRTFRGASRSDVEDQIEDFFLKEGAREYGALLQEIQQRSPIGPVDGNPHSSTAFIADTAFMRLGIHAPPTFAWQHDGGDLRLAGGGGTIETNVADGSFAWAGVGTTLRIGRVGFALGAAGQYREIEGAQAYTVTTLLGLPIELIRPRRFDRGVTWQVAPLVTGGISASADFVAGGLLLGGGVASSLALRAGDWTVSMGNEVVHVEGTNIEWEDYELATDVGQTILKNGAKLSWEIGGSPVYVDAGIIYTNLLDEAAVDNYWTPLAGVGLRLGDYSSLRLGYSSDIGTEDYTSHTASLLLHLGF